MIIIHDSRKVDVHVAVFSAFCSFIRLARHLGESCFFKFSNSIRAPLISQSNEAQHTPQGVHARALKYSTSL